MTNPSDEFDWVPGSALAEPDEDCLQDDFDFDFFSQVLQRSPYHLDALRRQVELLAQRGEHQLALALDRRLLEIRPEDCIVRYNYACSLAMTRRLELALGELEIAFQLGYEDWDHVRFDSDLDSIRDRRAFREMVLRYKYFGSKQD